MLTNRRSVLFLATLGVAAAVIMNTEPSVRIIPADVLRDFPAKCYSWTSQTWHKPNETWSLKPFCGKSRCVALRNTKTNVTFLSEEVTDCGLIVDTEQTPACKLVEDKVDVKADFPECCPVFDCDEGAQIVYKKKGSSAE